MESTLLTLRFYRKGQDLVASGFLVFAVGEGIMLSGGNHGPGRKCSVIWGRDRLVGSVRWAHQCSACLPPHCAASRTCRSHHVRGHGRENFAGVQILSTSSPVPFYPYPFFVATFFGWIGTLLKPDAPQNSVVRSDIV